MMCGQFKGYPASVWEYSLQLYNCSEYSHTDAYGMNLLSL